jgi:hypothetical protein
MNNSLIDTDLFADGMEPWVNQVFKKDFDAYFFLSHPAFQYNPNEPNIFDPFDFLNNLQEKNIYISSPSGKSNLGFALNSNWNRQLYLDAYQQNISDERFLFWQSENEKWAMVSDSTYKVAVIGIDWKICDEVPFFFQQCLLSPIQFLQKIGKQEHEAIFLKNYQPASVLTEGNLDNPMWVKYFFQCHVENENDKLFYWTQFEKIFNVIHPLLKHFKSLDMYADQAFTRRCWMNKQWYSSGKTAPVGGWQKYSYKNCEKVANKFLNDNEHLRLAFEGRSEESKALYIANKKGLIEFFTFWIYASLQKAPHSFSRSDFYFQTSLHSFGNKSDIHNQNFNFCYKKESLEEANIENLVMQLAEIGFAIKIHKLEKPYIFAIFTKNEPMKIEGMYSALPDLETDLDLFKTGVALKMKLG